MLDANLTIQLFPEDGPAEREEEGFQARVGGWEAGARPLQGRPREARPTREAPREAPRAPRRLSSARCLYLRAYMR